MGVKANRSKWRDGIGLNLTDGGNGTAGSKHIRTDEMRRRNQASRIKETGIAVIQYGLDGNAIKEFPAKRLITKELGISRTTLKNILNNNTGYTYLPYTFKYKGQPFIKGDIKKKVRGSTNARTSNSATLIKKYGKPILQYSLDGKFIKEHPSVTMAQRDTGVIRQSIYSNIRGKMGRAGDFTFRYKQ